MWTKVVGNYFRIMINITRGHEGKAGSAGEQPVRNKVDAYNEKGVSYFMCSTLTFLVSPMS